MTKKHRDDEKLSPFWAEAKRAADEVAKWSPSKRMETVYRVDTAPASTTKPKPTSTTKRSLKA